MRVEGLGFGFGILGVGVDSGSSLGALGFAVFLAAAFNDNHFAMNGEPWQIGYIFRFVVATLPPKPDALNCKPKTNNPIGCFNC